MFKKHHTIQVFYKTVKATHAQPMNDSRPFSFGFKTSCKESTCDFVSHEFAGLDLSNAAEQTLQLLLSHVLREIVDDQIGFTVLAAVRGLSR